MGPTRGGIMVRASAKHAAFAGILAAVCLPLAAAAGSAPDDDASGAAGDWDSIVAAAVEEGEVTLYSVVVPEINDRLESAFEDAYPDIDLEIIRTVGGEIDANLDAE